VSIRWRTWKPRLPNHQDVQRPEMWRGKGPRFVCTLLWNLWKT